MNIPIVILCGGLGTRISKITNKIPKSLVKINGKPFLEYQIKLLKQNNFKTINLCIGYKGKLIINYLKSKNNFNVEVRYSSDGKFNLGTGGALKKMLKKMNTEYFFLTYGDSYLPEDYNKIKKQFIKKKSKNIMCIYKNNNKYDKSNIMIKNSLIISYNKNNQNSDFIDYGLSIINRNEFLKFAENFDKFDVSSYFKYLIKKKKLNYIRVYKRFYEIGSYSGIKSLSKIMN
tara:strand:+ start:495 stop:1187 length:693 start_codon:yes stop_codon:yes gene_type:complete